MAAHLEPVMNDLGVSKISITSITSIFKAYIPVHNSQGLTCKETVSA